MLDIERNETARRSDQRVSSLNPFAMFGDPCSPMRMMLAPLEIALYLPAYAINNFHGGQRSGRRT